MTRDNEKVRAWVRRVAAGSLGRLESQNLSCTQDASGIFYVDEKFLSSGEFKGRCERALPIANGRGRY